MANAEITSSGSDLDEKKRKRKLSNRESARRSRLKKQRLMEDTIHEISSLERRIKENSEKYRLVKQRFDSIESENAILKSEKMWLSSYIRDLENMIATSGDDDQNANANAEITGGDCRSRPWRLGCDSLQAFASFKT